MESFSDLLAADLPEELLRLVDGLLPEVGCGFLAGPAKGRKTWIVLYLIVALLSGRKFFGRATSLGNAQIVYVYGEGSRAAIRKRILMICRGMGVDPLAIADRLSLVRVRGLDLTCGAHVARIRRKLDQLAPSPKLLIVDPLSRVHRAEENSRSEMEPVLDELYGLSDDYGMFVLVVHHSSKVNEKGSAHPLRGSSALAAWSDALLWIPPAKLESEVRVLHAELRDGEAPAPITFRVVVDKGRQEARVEIVSGTAAHEDPSADRAQAVLTYLQQHGPCSVRAVREHLRCNNTVASGILRDLIDDGLVADETKGARQVYRAVATPEEDGDEA